MPNTRSSGRSSQRRLRWIGSVCCEGGPVLITDAESLPEWTGARPISCKQKLLHLWGQFTGELPERFRSAGEVGHQYVDCGTHQGARAMLNDLVKHVATQWPGTTIERDEHGVQLTRADGRTMRAELAPSSEYDAACMASGNADAWSYTFGQNRRAVLWEVEGGGTVDIGFDASRHEIVLLRTWVDGDEGERKARRFVAAAPPESQTEHEIEIASGAMVIAWAPTAYADLVTDEEPPPREPGSTTRISSIPPGAPEDVGLAIQVEPGRYAVSVGRAESDGDRDEDDENGGGTNGGDEGDDESGWSARWCRLRRVG